MLVYSRSQEKVTIIEDGRPPLRVRVYETHMVPGAWRVEQRADGWYASRKGSSVGPCGSEGLLNQRLREEG